MKNLVFLLEGRSEKEMLEGFLPKILPYKIQTDYIVFEGKKSLEKKLIQRLNGWNKPDSAFVILLDQDQENCKHIKKRLLDKCQQCRKPLKYLVRIACHELESWYLGDLKAVGQALNKPRLSDRYKNKQKYKNPDKMNSPAKELTKITNKEYQKISGSRSIGPLLAWEINKSQSFKVFVKGIIRLVRG